VLELLKPVTWFPPMWAFACGVVSSGVSPGSQWPLVLLGVAVAGPLVCATSQAANDWFDRHVDALNEPHRPIPSGRIPGRWGLYLAVAWTLLSTGAAYFLGRWGFIATLVALVLAWAYSAPPFRLKRNGWVGNLAVGLSYEGLAWVTGAAVVLGGLLPPVPVLILALLYSLGAHGIMTLNDFKSREGDLRMGIDSLPALLGPWGAAVVACQIMVTAQVIVILLLLHWGTPLHAGAVTLLLVGQLPLMARLVSTPTPRRALEMSGFGVPLFVLGMMISAFAVRGGVL
jgi:chlorophyll/bacteriochlorophyll a synthase